LSSQGLFDEARKRSLPLVPKKISIVTSPTGAVVHDILNIIQRRFDGLHVEIVPVRVQGHGAAGDIVSALHLLNERNDTDVIVLARGGGSLEDLHAFNDEDVAWAVFNSGIPVVSAVGHETDFSITDFVADLRAPTPSAAAEMITPMKDELSRRLEELADGMALRLKRLLELRNARLREMSNRLRDPRKRVQDARMRLDDLSSRLFVLIDADTQRKREWCQLWIDRLYNNNPNNYIDKLNSKLKNNYDNLLKNIKKILNSKCQPLEVMSGRLQALNPMAVLARGYSITRTIPEALVVRNSRTVSPGQTLEILLEKGSITATVNTRMTIE
jgi:exodeoxyribonuclease VII large subunit